MVCDGQGLRCLAARLYTGNRQWPSYVRPKGVGNCPFGSSVVHAAAEAVHPFFDQQGDFAVRAPHGGDDGVALVQQACGPLALPALQYQGMAENRLTDSRMARCHPCIEPIVLPMF